VNEDVEQKLIIRKLRSGRRRSRWCQRKENRERQAKLRVANREDDLERGGAEGMALFERH
jgi:hypothetical protein